MGWRGSADDDDDDDDEEEEEEEHDPGWEYDMRYNIIDWDGQKG